jgi:hypothetical protein
MKARIYVNRQLVAETELADIAEPGRPVPVAVNDEVSVVFFATDERRPAVALEGRAERA